LLKKLTRKKFIFNCKIHLGNRELLRDARFSRLCKRSISDRVHGHFVDPERDPKLTVSPPRAPPRGCARGLGLGFLSFPSGQSLLNRLLLSRRAWGRGSGRVPPARVALALSSSSRVCPASYYRAGGGGWVDSGPVPGRRRPPPLISISRHGRAQSFANHLNEDGVS
jgi:hypothetical protein